VIKTYKSVTVLICLFYTEVVVSLHSKGSNCVLHMKNGVFCKTHIASFAIT